MAEIFNDNAHGMDSPLQSEAVLPSSNTCYRQFVEFCAFTLHVLTCQVFPLAFCMQAHAHAQRLEDSTACPIAHPCLDLPVFDGFICLLALFG